MKKPICTVLLVSYNHKNYIAKAIESVLEQKTQYEFKLHIFDDGSIDDTAKIIKNYAKKYPKKIKAFTSKKNKGAQANIWKAYKSVDTKYCALLEGDDFWCDENKLELQINALEENPECSFCAHQTKIINENDVCRPLAHEQLIVKNKNVLNKNIISYVDIENELKGFMNHMSSRLIRMSCVDLKKIKYKEAFLYDNCQFYYLLLKGDMYFINKTMSCYVQTGEGRFTSLSAYKRIDMHIRALNDFNSETNFVIMDRIIKDMHLFINYYFAIIENKNKEQIVTCC